MDPLATAAVETLGREEAFDQTEGGDIKSRIDGPPVAFIKYMEGKLSGLS